MRQSFGIFLCYFVTFVLIEAKPWCGPYGCDYEYGDDDDFNFSLNIGDTNRGGYGRNDSPSPGFSLNIFSGGGNDGGRGRNGGGNGRGHGGREPPNYGHGGDNGNFPNGCTNCRISSFGNGNNNHNVFNLPKEAYVNNNKY